MLHWRSPSEDAPRSLSLGASLLTPPRWSVRVDRTAYYRTFVGKWDDDDEDLFTNHLKRYCHALRPDSGIAFHETDRSVSFARGLAA